eukprot:3341008-Prymnesium_polylepis.1
MRHSAAYVSAPMSRRLRRRGSAPLPPARRSSVCRGAATSMRSSGRACCCRTTGRPTWACLPAVPRWAPAVHRRARTRVRAPATLS